ncbi:Uncharacterized protein YjbI, contains pentapeptide repeats [Desulfuromusa kysingii]|uniref:Uncharacterized protein YjbI, contains pentapeptide repeats n=1 Tax=Desulfuromusa kysingii TaxID=37625 RepID=A0A1H3YA12_9BACT|nr:pentapeptide repeat-containing protein [Desulfuromusa kysingii]SEA08515.1 Uncharacterized protein YjbI, contains pentapeptide repeats [Desulfuromusa kysingii]
MAYFENYNDGIEFKNLCITEQDINGFEFNHCDFSACNFSGSTFNKCRFENSTFMACNLSLIKPKDCSFIDVDFRNCKAIGVDWAEASMSPRINFYACTLNSSSFFGLNLSKIIMTDCSAMEVDFTEAILAKGVFALTNFSGSRFAKTNFTQADMRQATNYAINPDYNILKQTHFSVPEVISLLSGLDIILDS